jgi:YaiO family outer membrane protein
MYKKNILLSLTGLMLLTNLLAQTTSSDEYFQLARKAAFENDNYPVAISLSKQALQQSPGYTDIQVFLGRVYYWSGYSDSSISVLKAALEAKPGYEETAIAIADIEYYNAHYTIALYYAEQGLSYNPSSIELKVRKAKYLAALSRFNEAGTIMDSLLLKDPKNPAFRSLAGGIKDQRSKNKIGVSYDRTGFDKQFENPWHFVSIDYTRQTKAGSFTGRVNFANRHKTNGLQFEVDAYPRISKVFYAYTNIGYSDDMPVFPKFRAGFSLYANLPHSFEADGGFRYLNFDSDTWIYTIGLGKYYKNFWFSGRTYLTPSNSRISRSYNLTTRYYLNGGDNYLALIIGQGISPDDRSLVNQLNNQYKLRSKKIGADYRFTAGRMNIFSLSTMVQQVEYLPKTNGTQVNISFGYQRRF